jgi:hypothetical protein
VLACSQVFDTVTSPELAEALAIRRALSLAREEGFNKIILALDCLTDQAHSEHCSGLDWHWRRHTRHQVDRGRFCVCGFPSH